MALDALQRSDSRYEVQLELPLKGTIHVAFTWIPDGRPAARALRKQQTLHQKRMAP